MSVDGKVLLPAGTDLGDRNIDELVAAGVDEVKIRSVLTCDSKVGQCAACYGRSLAAGQRVAVGEAVGACARGLISQEQVDKIERAICPGEGACGGMYTANTMATSTNVTASIGSGTGSPFTPDFTKTRTGKIS